MALVGDSLRSMSFCCSAVRAERTSTRRWAALSCAWSFRMVVSCSAVRWLASASSTEAMTIGMTMTMEEMAALFQEAVVQVMMKTTKMASWRKSWKVPTQH